MSERNEQQRIVAAAMQREELPRVSSQVRQGEGEV